MGQKSTKDISSRQFKFAEGYLKGKTLYQAKLDAGYAKTTSTDDIMKTPQVKEFIAELLSEQKDRLEITIDRIVNEYALIGFASIKNYYDADDKIIDIKDLSYQAAAAIKELKITEVIINEVSTKVTTELKLHDKQASLRDLGTHFQMFKDRTADPDEKDVTVEIQIVDKRET